VEELDHHILVANRKQMVAISLRGACPLFGDFVRLRVGPDPAVSRTGELGERVNENRRMIIWYLGSWLGLTDLAGAFGDIDG
jgi:hypothetical protein